MSATIEEYEALCRAIRSGLLQHKVRYQDREEVKQYRDADSMERAKRNMARELGLIRTPNRVFTSFSKGLAR